MAGSLPATWRSRQATGRVKNPLHILSPAPLFPENDDFKDRNKSIMVVERRRLPGAAMSQLVARLSQMQNRKNYKFIHLDPGLVISSHTLTVIPDIFDRLIVAETLRLGLPIITSDSVIRASGLVNVIWS